MVWGVVMKKSNDFIEVCAGHIDDLQSLVLQHLYDMWEKNEDWNSDECAEALVALAEVIQQTISQKFVKFGVSNYCVPRTNEQGSDPVSEETAEEIEEIRVKKKEILREAVNENEASINAMLEICNGNSNDKPDDDGYGAVDNFFEGDLSHFGYGFACAPINSYSYISSTNKVDFL